MFVISFPCQFLLIFLDLIGLHQSDLPVNLKYMNGLSAQAWYREAAWPSG